jgi:hypothetical protein
LTPARRRANAAQMLDLRPVGYVIGLLVSVLGIAMIVPMLVDIAEGRGHWPVFVEAGLITSAKDGRVRTCAIVPESLAPARSWIDEQRALWEDRFDRLDAYVTQAMRETET